MATTPRPLPKKARLGVSVRDARLNTVAPERWTNDESKLNIDIGCMQTMDESGSRKQYREDQGGVRNVKRQEREHRDLRLIAYAVST